MTYLDEAYRRFKLPIRVGVWETGVARDRPFYGIYVNDQHYLFPSGAKTGYLAAVKELSQ